MRFSATCMMCVKKSKSDCRQREQTEQQLSQTNSRLDEEKRRLKQQHQSMLMVRRLY